MNDSADHVVLSVRDLQTYFYTQRGVGKAVDGVSFDLHRGETPGLVGESGCSKSMTSLSIVGLYPRPAARLVGGQILFDGEDLVRLPPHALRRYRGKRLAMILQDPMSALNPVFTIDNQLSEPLRLHQRLRGGHLRYRAIELLKLLRIPAPDKRLSSYPHQFNGGMRQRVAIARALALHPSAASLYEGADLGRPPDSAGGRARGNFAQWRSALPNQSPLGCHFHPRCPLALVRYSEDLPGLRPVSSEHRVACHLYG